MRVRSIIFAVAILVTATATLPAFGFVRDPWIQDISETTATIAWEADATGGTQRLEWGTDAQSLTESVDAELVSGQLYRATVNGLDVSSMFYYRVVSDAETSTPATFVTAACETEPFVFVATGDNRDGVADHQAVVDAILQHGGQPDFSINSGDIVDGTDYLEFFDVEKILLKDIPLFPSPGNHDDAAEYQYGFDRPLYYAYDYANARFIAANTDGDYSPGSTQYDWIVSELSTAADRKAAGEIDWIFVYHHHPAYSGGSHGNEGNVDDWLVPLYEQHGVDVVVNGHDHHYERSVVNDITYLVTGGGGVSLRGVTCDAGNGCVFAESIHHFTQFTVDGQILTIRAIDTGGNVIDSVTIDHGEPASGEPCNATGGDDPKGGDDPPPGGDDPPTGGNIGISGGCSCSLGTHQPAGPWSAGLLLALGMSWFTIRRRRRRL